MTRAGSGRRRGAVVAGIAGALALALLVAGYFLTAPALYALGWWSDGGQPTIPATLFTPPPTPQAQPDVGVVGMADGVKPLASAVGAVVQQRIDALKADGIGQYGWVVADEHGKALASKDATALLMPASTLKVLTGLVTIDSMAPEQRFATRVVQPSAGSIVLVGGGDPLLATQAVATGYPRPASLAELAADTAKALKAKNESSVTLSFDARLFTGPDWEPTWEPVFETDVTRISALIADIGVNQQTKARTKTPAADAAASFAALLREQGITVAPTIAAAAGGGVELAKVESLPVRVLVQQALLTSDNTVTEILLRHAAIASGQEASFTGGVAALRQHLTKLGLWADGAVLQDGSGVSRTNRVSPLMLAGVIRLILDEPKYRVLLDSLPVAGVTGTLRNRFTEAGALGGRGWVRAKTGSLRDASALAGFARSADGQDLVLVFMTNTFTNGLNAKVWIDQGAAVVASCGCR